MGRFEKIVVSIHCLLKVFKTSGLTFSLSTHAQHLCALGLRDMTKATKTEYISTETPYGNFHQLVLAFFLENLIGCICNHNKDVNSRGIKSFL